MTRPVRLALLLLAAPSLVLAQGRPSRAARAASSSRSPSHALKVWTAVSSGSGYTCALDNTGQAYCWGENVNRKLGIGDSINIRRPIAVETPQRFQSIAAGTYESCALTHDGAAECWGGESNPSPPHAVFGEKRFIGIDDGCAVGHDGIGWCWGSNSAGQLGSGREGAIASSGAERVAGSQRWQQIVVGSGHACGLSTTGAAWCWGRAETMGSPSTAGARVPVRVSGGHVFHQLASGSDHVCGIADAGVAWCWGDNQGGALGTGLTASSSIPVAVTGGLAFKALSAGFSYTCGLTTAGKAYCWGANAHGALGNGSTRPSPAPVAVAGTTTFSAIESGSGHTCAIGDGGALFCWGDNADGELGIAHAQSCRSAPVAGRAEARACALAPTRVQEPR